MIKNIAQSINAIDIKMEDTLAGLMDKFYQVMRENGVSMVTKHKNGSTTMCSPEWVLCKSLFLKRIDMQLSIQDLIGAPDDLKQ